MTKTYKLIKPIEDYPLVEYKEFGGRYYSQEKKDFIWSSRYVIAKEIVENMPEYFVEVKEDWIGKVIKDINNFTNIKREPCFWNDAIREAIEKNMPKQEVIIKECNKVHIEHNPMPPHFCLPWCCCNKFGWLAPIPTVERPTTINGATGVIRSK